MRNNNRKLDIIIKSKTVGYQVSLHLQLPHALNYSEMNITNWNDTEEVVVHIFLVAISFPMHLYVLFLTSAIFDFQDEKPKDQKTPFDVLIKDLIRTLFWLAYTLGLIQFISFFTPPLNNDIVYWFSYFMVFINHFTLASILVTVYIRNVFTFQPDDIEGIKVTTLRHKCMVSKLILTFVSMVLSILVPIETDPIIFQWLDKDRTTYDR